MSSNSKRFFLSFSIRGHDEPTIFEVTEKIQDELEIEMKRLCKGECWRRLNLDSACRFFFDRGLVANV